ncbi:MAG: hypothetical protein HC862_15860 [Scytonema sp. RU_4_4]|nr:hypothetical protein [Scytonema sp. RU_4_4]NJR73601.1 hypothetical protein [Scytonema sp. CRU_2_7]
MSQDNQNSQPPFSPPTEPNQPQPTVESASQLTQKQYQRVQPIWKAVTVRILRGTIGVLETTVEKLETQSLPGTEETPGFFQKLQLAWSAALGKIRSLLGENLSTKLSDTTLTGIIAGIAVILVWTTSTVFGGKPTEVATVPPEVETPPATITTSPEVEIPPTPSVAEETPPPVEEITPPSTEETPPPVAEETPPPAEETSPPEPEAEPIPTPTPTPTRLLTPEQTLIAAIENQVAEISDRFASGLIKSIQANFRSSRLAITISDDWYNLKQSEQDKLLAQMLQRSKELDFIHLDIVDSQGQLIARNPVVGTEIIVFQRRAAT